MVNNVNHSLNSIDIMKILEMIPHRYPFLLVDRITNMNNDDSCIGLKNVTYNEPYFQGHFPSNPIMPGVLIIEGMAQTAGALCVVFKGVEKVAKFVYFMTIDKAKFRRLVVPGDQIFYHMKKIKYKQNIWWFKGEAKVNDQIVAEAEISAKLVLS